MAVLKNSLRTGISFGLTSAIITTLGLMIGLHSGTHSRIAVLGGIFTIAVADAFSDALGIHVSEEFEEGRTAKEVWTSTLSTLLVKFFFTLTFAAPVILLPLGSAIAASLIWGFSILTGLSYVIAKTQGRAPWRIIGEHVLIAAVVILITRWVGKWVAGIGA